MQEFLALSTIKSRGRRRTEKTDAGWEDVEQIKTKCHMGR